MLDSEIDFKLDAVLLSLRIRQLGGSALQPTLFRHDLSTGVLMNENNESANPNLPITGFLARTDDGPWPGQVQRRCWEVTKIVVDSARGMGSEHCGDVATARGRDRRRGKVDR
jgi:hypothetical protein